MKHRCAVTGPDGQVSPDLLVAIGPLAAVILSHPIDTADRLPTVRNVQVNMLIDTGAFKTVVDRGIAEALGLEPIRYEEMAGISHVPENCPVYLMSASIGVADDHRKSLVTFTAEMIGMSTPPSERQFSGVLGRDFLRHGRLSYDGKAGHCDLIFDVPAHSASSRKNPRKEKRKAEKAARRKNRH